MSTNTLTLLLQVGGLLHLGLICAGLIMPKVVDLRTHLAALPILIRRLFWIYYSLVGLCLIGFGLLTFTLAGTLAAGSTLSRALCLFLAAFWTLRLVAALFVFDVRPYLTNFPKRISYHAINAVFVYLPVIYLLAAWKGARS